MHKLQHAVGGLGHGAGFGLAIAALGGIAVATATAVKAIKDAASYSEQYDRAQVVLGKDAKILTDQIDLMNKAFGTNKTEALAAGSAVAAIFKGAGYADEDVAKLSVHVLKLATDLGSLAHIDFGVALEKIMSGLAGQVRPLREVSVFMSDDLIKAYAYAHGIAKVNAELTESEKIQARLGFITEKLGFAVGNRLKTADSPVNQFRESMGRINTILIEIGKVALPVLANALQGVNLLLSSAQAAWQASGLAGKESITDVTNGAKEVSSSLGMIQTPILAVLEGYHELVAWSDMFQSAVVGTGATFAQLGSIVVSVIPAGIAAVKGLYNAVIYLATSPYVAAEAFVTFVGSGIQSLGAMVSAFVNTHSIIGSILTAIVRDTVNFFQPVVLGIQWLSSGISTLISGLGTVGQAIISTLAPIGQFFAGIGDMISSMTGKISNLAQEWSKYFDGIAKNLNAQSFKLFQEGEKHFAFDASKSLKDFLARGAAEINAARERLKKEGQLDLSKIKPMGAGVQAGEAGHENKAILAFSSDAANAILKSRYGQAQGGAQAQVAKNTGQALPKLDKINESLTKMAASAGAALGLLPIPGLG